MLRSRRAGLAASRGSSSESRLIEGLQLGPRKQQS